MKDNDNLEARSGYCICSEMQELFKFKRAADEQRGRCDTIRAEADLKTPRPDDLDYLKNYRDESIKLQGLVAIYYIVLDRYSNSGQVTFISHTKKRDEVIPREQLGKLLKKQVPITIHCSNCKQQIDVAC